jgi:flagellar biosynthetic protein FliP
VNGRALFGNAVIGRLSTTRLAVAFTALLISLIGSIGIAEAQNFNLDFGDGGSTTARVVQFIALLTLLSLAPSIIVMVTSFTRIVVVLAFLRSAIGTQQTPPNTVLVSLALFLTAFVMAPTLETAYEQGIQPLIAEEITEVEAFERTMTPIKDFMLQHVRQQDLRLFMDMAELEAVDTPEVRRCAC